MADVAAKLNLSISTVSRAMSGGGRIGEKTVARVKKTAMEMGYQLNPAASGLKKKRMNIIGLLIPDITHHLHAKVVSCIQELCYEKGYSVMIAQTKGDDEKEKKLLQTMISSKVSGLITTMLTNSHEYSHYESFRQRNIPVVFYNSAPENDHYSIIKNDDHYGAFIATELLVKKGCKRIGYISEPITNETLKFRFEGYREALNRYNLPWVKELTCFCPADRNETEQAIASVITDQNDPDGLFASDDYYAAQAMRIAKRQGIVIPDELALVGYSNHPSSALLSPSLSTIDQSPEQIGVEAFESLMDALSNGHETSMVKKIIGVKVIERESSGVYVSP